MPGYGPKSYISDSNLKICSNPLDQHKAANLLSPYMDAPVCQAIFRWWRRGKDCSHTFGLRVSAVALLPLMEFADRRLYQPIALLAPWGERDLPVTV